jgi:hypothetical protein
MKIDIVWGSYVVYDHGMEDISQHIGEKTININNSDGTKISELVIDCTNKTIIALPIFSGHSEYNVMLDDGILSVDSGSGSSGGFTQEVNGVKISELPNAGILNQSDIFALSRDDGNNGSYDRTLHVTLADLINSINPSATYELIVNDVDPGGDVYPVGTQNYVEGRLVNVGITLDYGYGLTRWESDWAELNGRTEVDLTFSMPAQSVTLTPVVELIDVSTWSAEMYSVVEGWASWDPDATKYSDGETKTSIATDSLYFYYNQDANVFTCILFIDDEFEWLKEEINTANWNNLGLEYIDQNGVTLQTAGGVDMMYTGADLQQTYDGPGQPIPLPAKMGIVNASTPSYSKNGMVYLGIEFDQAYPSVRARITQLSTGSTITSKNIFVYSYLDPVFGLGV